MFKSLSTWAVGLALTGLCAEVLVRLVNPTPRAQVIHSQRPGELTGLPVVVRHGQPTWEQDGTVERHHDACEAPPGHRVVIFGTSISFGISLPPADALGARLEGVLNAAGQGAWCVHNYAQPAYTGSTKLALAEDVVPRLQPDLIVWEVWGNEGDRYTEVGDDWYNFHGRRLDEAGLPYIGVPATVNAGFFRHSALYRYGLLALAPTGVTLELTRRDLDTRYLPLLDAQLRQTPAPDVFFLPMFFDRPLLPQIDDEPVEFRWIREFGARGGMPFVSLAEAWRDEDRTPLAIDSCHWSPAGSQRAAEVLAPVILEAAAQR